MKPVFQTKFTNEQNTQHGNCLAACVASLIECDLSEVPSFEECPSDGSWFTLLWNFLASKGYEIQGARWKNENESVEEFFARDSYSVDGYNIVSGASPRTYVKRGHSVIYKDGVLAHDPHPSGEGLISIRDMLMIEKSQV